MIFLFLKNQVLIFSVGQNTYCIWTTYSDAIILSLTYVCDSVIVILHIYIISLLINLFSLLDTPLMIVRVIYGHWHNLYWHLLLSHLDKFYLYSEISLSKISTLSIVMLSVLIASKLWLVGRMHHYCIILTILFKIYHTYNCIVSQLSSFWSVIRCSNTNRYEINSSWDNILSCTSF